MHLFPTNNFPFFSSQKQLPLAYISKFSEQVAQVFEFGLQEAQGSSHVIQLPV